MANARNYLNAKQNYILTKYIMDHIEGDTFDPYYSLNEIAEHCTEHLGFTVTDGNIRGIAREWNIKSLGRKRHSATPDTATDEATAKAIENLTEQVTRIARDHTALWRLLDGIISQLQERDLIDIVGNGRARVVDN